MGTGYLASSFDLLNVGHLDVVAQARMRCRTLVVGVFDDELVAALTGRRPVVPLVERLALVEHLRGVTRAVVHTPERPAEVGATHVFVEAGDEAAGLIGAERLAPGRQTASAVLLAALAPFREQAVAG